MLVNKLFCESLSQRRVSMATLIVFLLLTLSACSGKLTADSRQKPVEAINFRVNSVVLSYGIDKSAVPPISFNDMTYTHNVGDSQSITVFADGKSVPFIKRATDEIIFTTNASAITITLNDISLTNDLGSLNPTALKNDKAWAWSHSFDDNTFLQESINVFESYGYRGTVYLIARDVWPDRDEDWTLDEPNLHQLLANGWSIGNHTWAHECNSEFDYVASIMDGYNRMQEVVDNSGWPSYKLTAFSAPCFDPAYHPLILQMRNEKVTNVQFNESGFEHLLAIDNTYTETTYIDDRRVSGFNFDLPIGRDVNFENYPNEVVKTFDWMSANTNADQHFWYNTFSHGNNENTVRVVLDHIDKRYARNGNDEVWIAPADEIYSYLLLREKMVIGSDTNILTTEAPQQPIVQVPTVEQEQVVEQVAVSEPATQVPTVEQVPVSEPATQEPITQPAEQLFVAPITEAIRIEVAHQSGVSGFPFSVFGAGFGQTQGDGSVMINNTTAQIVRWQDGLIEGIVPQTADSETTLVVTNFEGNQASDKFTVYSIDPQFLQPVTQTFRNVAQNKQVFATTADDHLCYRQPGNIIVPPARFLTDYRCGYQGYTRVGDAVFSADATLGRESIIAVDMQEILQGDYLFQFFSEANWYPHDERGKSFPKAYEIEISADSTNGENGSWQTVYRERNNDRATRLHAVTIPDGNYRWVRMRVTDGNGDSNEERTGKDFYLREIRFYETSNTDNARPATYAVYGDSLTADAFELIGPMGFSERLKSANGDNNDVVFSALGLSGMDSQIFEPIDWRDVDMYDAFAMDDMGQQMRFWGIGIGTNDSGSGSGELAVDYSNISLFDERLASIIPFMVAQGNVPLVARIPDTSSEWGFSADLLAKKSLLADIDAIAARYRLIPGPDFYTLFRKNIDHGNSTFIRQGDGIHHTELGHVEFVNGWADAFARIPFTDATTATQPTVVDPIIAQPILTVEAPQACNNEGLTLSIFDGITGDIISDLTSNPAYPDTPTRVQRLEAFETISTGDEFGARVSGYITAPITGNYTFWIAGDDKAELWLSTDASRGNLSRIAYTPDWTWSQQWDKFDEQQSLELRLEAGQRYYVEALWKDFYGGDHLSVAWETPISEQALITGDYLCHP